MIIARFLISTSILFAADERLARLKQAISAGNERAARAVLSQGVDFLADEDGESAYEAARRYKRTALLAEMEALRRRKVLAAFRIESAETVTLRQNFLAMQRNPAGRNEILKPEARVPRAGHVFLILDTVLLHPFPARLTDGKLQLLDTRGNKVDPYLPWDGYIPVNWSPLATWNSVNGEAEEVPSDRRRILFEVRADAVRGAKLQLFGTSYAIPWP